MAEGNEIDRLMSLDPLQLSAQDIDAIILYHRKARLEYTSTGKAPKRKAEGTINLEAIGLVKKGPPMKRRKL